MSDNELARLEYISTHLHAAMLSSLTINRDEYRGHLAESAVAHARALIKELDKVKGSDEC